MKLHVFTASLLLATAMAMELGGLAGREPKVCKPRIAPYGSLKLGELRKLAGSLNRVECRLLTAVENAADNMRFTDYPSLTNFRALGGNTLSAWEVADILSCAHQAVLRSGQGGLRPGAVVNKALNQPGRSLRAPPRPMETPEDAERFHDFDERDHAGKKVALAEYYISVMGEWCQMASGEVGPTDECPVTCVSISRDRLDELQREELEQEAELELTIKNIIKDSVHFVGGTAVVMATGPTLAFALGSASQALGAFRSAQLLLEAARNSGFIIGALKGGYYAGQMAAQLQSLQLSGMTVAYAGSIATAGAGYAAPAGGRLAKKGGSFWQRFFGGSERDALQQQLDDERNLQRVRDAIEHQAIAYGGLSAADEAAGGVAAAGPAPSK